MTNKNTFVKSAITGILALTAINALAATPNIAAPDANMEKCYGIVKAGMNDCQTSNAACAGSATKDRQPDAFIFLPKGVCDKIVGSSLTTKTDTKKK